MKHPTLFDGVRDLARLPWFELKGDGELHLDPAVGLCVDVHAHLVQGPIGRDRKKLLDPTAHIEEYLPPDATFDLDVYANRNFDEARLAAVKKDLVFATATTSTIKCTHTLPNLERRMRALKIARTCILPIEAPVGASNAALMLEATRGREAAICFGSVHPYQRDPEGKVRAQVAAGARGIKYHPAVQLVPPDSARAMRIFRAAGEQKVPVLFHCGPVDIEVWLGRRFSQVHRYEKALAQCPGTTFVLGHSGALQPEAAVELHRRYPNAWLELSCQSVSSIRRILEHGDATRIVWGTDWPFYHQAMGLAKLLLATDGAEHLRPALLRDNAARLLGLDLAALAAA